MSVDTQRTAIIEKMRLARIEYAIIENGLGLDGEEFAIRDIHGCNTRMETTAHKVLSPLDPNDSVPSCNECGKKSAYYCVMNDVYYCQKHLMGHDDNEV